MNCNNHFKCSAPLIPLVLYMFTVIIVHADTSESIMYEGIDPGRFALVKGQGSEVCEAYLERLTTSDYTNVREPRCERPEDTKIKGFEQLNRVILAPEELHNIYERLMGFANHKDPHYYELERKRRQSVCENPKLEEACKRAMEEEANAEARGDHWAEPYTLGILSDGHVVAWRYKPEVDIDNDGQGDRVLLFMDHHNGCGTLNYRGYIEGGPTYPYLMDADYQTVDEERTRTIFGHPSPEWPRFPSHKPFHYIGSKVGIFRYKDQYYFDTFFHAADFENQRQWDKTLLDTLAVFHRQGGETRQVCEYRWHNPYNSGKGEQP